MKQRFSKQAVTKFAELRMKILRDRNDFDPNNGTVQLRQNDKYRAVDYGGYDELRTLLDHFGLGDRR